MFLVHFKGHGVDGIDAVQPHAALKTGAGLLTQHPQELDLFDQVFHVLVHMGKAADGVAGQMRGGRGQARYFWFLARA